MECSTKPGAAGESLARKRFFAAAERGDRGGLETLLAHDVTLLSGSVPGVSIRRLEVNRSPGALYLNEQRQLIAVVALDIADGQVKSISSIVNPDKLAHLGPVGDVASLPRPRRPVQ